MKNKKALLFILALIAVLVFIKIKFLTNPVQPVPAATPGKGPATIVTAYVVKAQKTDNVIFASGTVIANEEVVLMPEVSGKVTQLTIVEGGRVTKGDLLVKINDADLQAQLKKIEMQLKLAEDKEVRSKKLLEVKGLSQEDYDVALNQVNSLKADLEYTRALIAKTEIRSPFNGVVGLKSVSEGSFVSPSVKIAAIQQLDPVKIDFSIPEKYSSLVKKGDKIIFTINNDDTKYNGEIFAMEPKIDLSSRTLQLRAVCPNPDGKIFPGSFARISLVLSNNPNAIMIPTEAVIPELKGQKVFVSKNGEAQPQKILISNRTDVSVEVSSGLQEGDTVIVTGIMQLKPGAKVKITQLK